MWPCLRSRVVAIWRHPFTIPRGEEILAPERISFRSPVVKPENRVNPPAAAEPNHHISLHQVEKRIQPRFPVSVAAETVEPTTQTEVTGPVVNLGVGGCFVETNHPFPEGTKIRVHFSRDGRSFRCRALVTHTDSGRGMGLAFTEVDPIEKNSVLDWVISVGGVASGNAHLTIDA